MSTLPVDPLAELKEKAKELISVGDVLFIISQKFSCSLTEAAEILLFRLPCENDFYGRPINPSFFGKKVGLGTFVHCEYTSSVRRLLLDIIENRYRAFNIYSDDDDVPF
ncbi:hypothetical protein ACVSUJ_18570 [Yersinia enterocolitica]|uniref:hypothetical protein n=1 Tax=Yersinia enterocolitica TaxID=630 RepID=UPI001C60FD68|nr:hypothetical protein [Yersinia enterocolitica]MBW5852516.1 hypothetical protein [Yersinia enterocolitica]MBX9477463.1 hypothetical protein [Yersinia enterocolitica]